MSCSLFGSRILAKINAVNWEDAVSITGKMLASDGLAETRYIDAMVLQLKKHGPYVVIVPGVAIVHSRPEDGALGNGMAIVTLKNPVVFGHPENDPVDVVIGFSAKDSNQHLLSIQKLGELLMQSDFLSDVRRAETNLDLQSVIEEHIRRLEVLQ